MSASEHVFADFAPGDRVRILEGNIPVTHETERKMVGAVGQVVSDPTGWVNRQMGWIEVRLDDEYLRMLMKRFSGGENLLCLPEELEKTQEEGGR